MGKQSKNPFQAKGLPGFGLEHIETVDAQSRLEEVRTFNVGQLRAVIAMPRLQKTVKQAAERRLRKLIREKRSTVD